MAATAQSAIAVIGIDIGKNSFHVVGLDLVVAQSCCGRSGRVVRWKHVLPISSPCLLSASEACVGAHPSQSQAQGVGGTHARLMPATVRATLFQGQNERLP